MGVSAHSKFAHFLYIIVFFFCFPLPSVIKRGFFFAKKSLCEKIISYFSDFLVNPSHLKNFLVFLRKKNMKKKYLLERKIMSGSLSKEGGGGL